MNKGKIVLYIAALLIITNVALIGFSYFKPQAKKHQENEGPKNIVIKKLNFNNEQVADYERLIKEHRESIVELEKELGNVKKDLYKSIINPKIVRDSLLNEIGKKQIEIEKVHLNHFGKIREICSQEQILAFEDLIQEMEKVFSRPRGKNGPPPR